MATNTTSCPKPMAATSNGVWDGDSPLNYALPLIILQICLVVLLTRSLAYLLRPLRQPRVVAEIIGGIVLGPSVLGRSDRFLNTVFPKQSLTVLDTLANIGLLFFLFLVGLEIDVAAIRRTGKPALAIAIVGISVPFGLGVGSSFAFRNTISKEAPFAPFLVFMGVAISITALPVLARILAELKLLATDLGRMAMSAAAVNDVAAWVLLALAIALSNSGSALVAIWVLLTGAAFVIVLAIFVRPILAWIARQATNGEPAKELYICIMLCIVLAASFATDAIGIHALFGAFVVGVCMPKEGSFANVMTEKVEDLVSGLFLPLYFVSSGLKTNVATINGATSWALLLLVIAVACFGKILGTFVVSLAVKIPAREAITLGFLMNTKGLVELIVLNIGKDRKVLNDESFAIMVLMALFTTFITTPFVMSIYKPARLSHPYKHRTIDRPNYYNTTTSSFTPELRILTCFHNSRNIPSIINLVESSRGIGRRFTVFALHLMELSERSSLISIIQKSRHNTLSFINSNTNDNGDRMVVAFEAYRHLSNVAIRPMRAVSDLSSIHEDIIENAELKRATLILLPFHKTLQVDGSLESRGYAHSLINQRVLRHAKCSVAILVDRGLGGASQVSASNVSLTITVLFFGGPDDREAVAYGAIMAEHPGVDMTVVRFLLTAPRDPEERSKDELALAHFRARTGTLKVNYEEMVFNGKEEIVKAIEMFARCNLFIVGRSPALMVQMVDRMGESMEIGQVGSYLASMELSTVASVLVIQRYDDKVGEMVTSVPEMEDSMTGNGVARADDSHEDV